MECDLDLVEARKKATAEAAQSVRTTTSQQQTIAFAPAAAGVATDIGEDTRLHEFDEQLARRLHAERSAAITTAIIGLVLGLSFVVVGFKLLGAAGGLKALGLLKPGYLRQQGFGVFANQVFLGAMALALGLAGLLVWIGQFQRAWTGHQAIQDVRFGGRPRIVSISGLTVSGLLIGSFVLPPLGIILGIIFKLSNDDETRELGGRMVMAALIAIALFTINLLFGLASGLKAAQSRGRSVPEPE